MSTADQPWSLPPRRRWCPLEMSRPPLLDPAIPPGPVQSRYVLLINPFYPKDPNASFGKHVLTPSLALTSFAATTPQHWQVRDWDENLLDGRPPFAPMPEMVGQPRKQSRAGRTARPLVSRRVRAACGLAGHRRWRAALAAHSGRCGSALPAVEIRGGL